MRSLAGLLVAIAASLTACAWPVADLRPYAETMQRVRVENRPIHAPSRSISGFSEALARMDRMLADSGLGAINISTKNLIDPTAKLGVNLKDMAITSLLRMSRVSNTFRVVDYEVDALRQDTVQTLTSILLPTGQMEIRRPQIYVSGGVSFNDANVLTRRRNIGLSGKSSLDGTPTYEGDLGYSSDVNIGVIGLDLHLGDFVSRSLLPGLEASNELIIATTGNGLDVGARLKKYGLQFEISSNIGQGQGAAMRALVDLALIELIGKWARVPYWQCVQIDAAAPDLQRELWYWFEAMNSADRIRLVKRALRQLGYFDGEIDDANGAIFRRALSKWQADNNLSPQAIITFETYDKLMSRFVERDDSGRFIRVGWSDDKPSLGAKVEEAIPQLALALNKKSGIFMVGESIFLRIMPNQSGFMRCYYEDSGGVISQVFPNPQQPQSLVEAGRAVMIPDTNRSFQLFSIEAKIPGRQSIVCTLASEDLQPKLAPAFAGTGLVPISGLTSLQTVVDAFKEVKATAAVGAAVIGWQILARPNAVPAPTSAPNEPAPAEVSTAPFPATGAAVDTPVAPSTASSQKAVDAVSPSASATPTPTIPVLPNQSSNKTE